jgi:hypothetical protein
MTRAHTRLIGCATAPLLAWLHHYIQGESARAMARDTEKGGQAASPRGGAGRKPAARAPAGAGSRKLIAFDPETLQALTLLARDRMQSFQELADEAFADLLKKHGRPLSLQQALRESLGGEPPAAGRRRARS